MTPQQQEAIWSAYLGLCVLQTMTRAANLPLANERATELLKELGEVFPFIPERIAQGILR